MPRRDGGRGDGLRAQAVLTGAERAATARDARGGRTGRGVGRTRGAVSEIPVVASNRGGLQVERVVDEDFWRPLGHGGRGVGHRVTRRRRRRAG